MKYVVLFVFMLLSCLLNAQTSADLKMEQQKIEKEIERIGNILEATNNDEKTSLSILQLTQQKTLLRKKLLATINKKIGFIGHKITKLQEEILIQENTLKKLQEKYARNVVYQYQTQGGVAWWKYLFSKMSVNQSIRMFAFFNIYRNSLLKLSDEIINLKIKIGDQVGQLQTEKTEKKSLAEQKMQEVITLQEEERGIESTVKSLRVKAGELRQEINNKRKQQRKLKDAIAAAIKKEIEEENRRKRELAKNKAKTKVDHRTDVVPKKASASNFDDNYYDHLSKNFTSRKGQMPWPVDGIIASSYGSDIFEGSTVSGKNIGTLFRADVGNKVFSIADGVVSVTILLQGIYTVIVRHGSFYCGYGNLEGIAVKKGDIVKESSLIGTVAKSDSGNWGELSVQILNEEGNNLNPEQFLRK